MKSKRVDRQCALCQRMMYDVESVKRVCDQCTRVHNASSHAMWDRMLFVSRALKAWRAKENKR